MKTGLRLLITSVSLSLAATASAQTIVALTDNDSLFTIASAGSPGAVSNRMALTGIAAGQTIAGMDYRPATGELFALGYNSGTGAAQLYTINATNGGAVAVGTAINLSLGTGSIGFDFNPTVDRIRVVGANRNNYRLNPITGGIAATDGTLQYALGDPNVLSLPSVGAVAYTNSFPGLTTTTLYDYDESLNVLSSQNPPNNGTLNTIGSSGIVVNSAARTTDMDIWFNPANKTNNAYFIANTGSGTTDNLYTISLTSGSATPLGSIGLPVKDIAVLPATFNSSAPLTGNLIYALATPGRLLLSFDSNNPEQLRSLMNITGVDSAMTLVGMDFRPADGNLYALGYTMGLFTNYRLYTINTATGVATPISSGNDTMSLGNTSEIGFDFNPTVDRIRVVSALSRANYRLNPNNGLIAAVDSNLQWTAGDVNAGRTVRVSTVAYTNSYPGATATALNGINDSGLVFVNINPPNNGRLNTVSSGIFGPASLSGTTDLDYYYDSATTSNTAYLAANPGSASVDLLYRINATGIPTVVDTIGYGLTITDIAVMPQFKNVLTGGVGVKGINSTQPVVYPNPASTAIRMALPASLTEASTYSIVDMTGRVMLQGAMAAGASTIDISLRGMADGIYILRVEGYAPVRFSKL